MKLNKMWLWGFVMFLCLATAVMAGDPEPKAFDPVWRELGNYIGVLVAGLLTKFVVSILKELEERKLISAQKESEWEARMESEAARIVAWVEAQSVNAGHKLNAEAKLAKAIEKLMARFGIDKDKAEELVEASLVPLGQGMLLSIPGESLPESGA